MTVQSIVLGGQSVGPGHRPLLVAELSANHNGSLERALETIEAAKLAGADAVKLQTFTADTMTIDHDGPGFRIEGGLWDGRSLHDLYCEASTPWEWHPALFAKGRELGITVFSTPFDETAVDFLEGLDTPAYKIASFEATDHPLIEKAAATGKPLIISTGLADRDEIAATVNCARGAGCRDLIVLHCVSAYPAPTEESNLRTMVDMARTFEIPVGLSDHSAGTAVSISAVALGAVLVEKHFTLDRADGGLDSAFSLEPGELAELRAAADTAWKALGTASYARTASEESSLVFRRSVYAEADIAAGDMLSAENIRRIRPGLGLPPKTYTGILGRRAKVNIGRGTPLAWDMIE